MQDSGEHPFSRLTPDAVIDAVESCSLVSDARILALNSYENRVYQVGIEDGEPIVVKFYRPERWQSSQILEEHDFSFELAALDIPVVAPLKFKGRSLLEYAGFNFALFPRRGGHSPEFNNFDDLQIMGRFMGRLHQVGVMKDFQTRRTLSIELFGEKSAEYLLDNDFIPEGLRDSYHSLSRDLLAKMREVEKSVASPTLIRIHGDCHQGNILWRDQVPHIVDLDDTMMGPAIQDLWMLLSGSRDRRLRQLAKLIEGYNEFFYFNPAELALIEMLRTLRLMNYSAWLARRWHDPAFVLNFPWFNTQRYWADHILELREQMAALDEPPLVLY